MISMLIAIAMLGRLDDAGFGVGVRVVELLCHREKSGRRETRLINMLQVINSSFPKSRWLL